MASDFFEQQDIARKKSGRLVFLLIAAVVGIVLVTYPVVAGAFYLLANSGNDPQAGDAGIPFWNIELFLLVTVGTLVLVSCSSFYKIAALKGGGGGSVARSLGGTPVSPDTRDPDERKLLNVVEEMAIASGIPVPPVYLLDHERGINAFAAGYRPDDAVIGVTRGAVEQLSRDELQGVIAHEFSHILNGDMRLNIRLMGLVFGILVLGILGRIALRVAFYSGGGRKKDAKAMLAIGLFGLLMIILGFVGVFFGKLIKAAVSRQREYLADASAVQYTRNPEGIGGALKRLAGFSRGSRVENPHAEEAAHMFFGSAVSSWLGGAMATHPPLPERIKRIDPSWDGTLPEPRESKTAKRGAPQGKSKPAAPDLVPGGQAIPGMPGGMLGTVVTGAVIADAASTSPKGSALDSVGQLDDAHIDYARQLIARIPGALREAARHPNGAQAVAYLILIDRAAQVRDMQMTQLDAQAEPAVAALVRTLLPHLNELPREARLSLLDLALPALQKMSREQYAGFRKQVDLLIEADGRVDLFEWTLRRLLTRHLEAHLFRPRDPKVHYYALKPVAEHCAVLLSTLARVGQSGDREVERAYALGADRLGLDGVGLVPRDRCKLSVVDRGFDELAKLSPREKKMLLHGCAAVIAADGEVTVAEGELMRAVADALDCPMPPLLPGQKLV